MFLAYDWRIALAKFGLLFTPSIAEISFVYVCLNKSLDIICCNSTSSNNNVLGQPPTQIALIISSIDILDLHPKKEFGFSNRLFKLTSPEDFPISYKLIGFIRIDVILRVPVWGVLTLDELEPVK